MNNISRRVFLKGSTAMVSISTLSSTTANLAYANNNLKYPSPPELTDKIYKGCAPHNCGGRCVLQMHIKNGRLARFTTDERMEKNIIDGYSLNNNDPQRRACVRCRSKKEWYYRKDRLIYPLKQTGDRGDITTFERISWEQAFKEIANKLKGIVGEDGLGGEKLFCHYSTGDGAGVPRAQPMSQRLLDIIGGSQHYRDDYSYPALEHVNAIMTANSTSLACNDRADVMNSEALVLWSWNGCETISTTNSSWYATQFRDTKGKEVYAIDSRYSKSATTLAKDGIFTPAAGTDAALISGILYCLLDEHLKECAAKGAPASQKSSWLNPDLIRRYTYGFFDTDTNSNNDSSYHNLDQKEFYNKYGVKQGNSLSAFLFGNDDRLVKAGLNQGISIYPNTIGYNVNGPNWNGKGANADLLYGKRTPIYGQLPKTSQWASKISGVSVESIKLLAKLYATKKVTTWVDGGFQRNSESEQHVWMLMTLAYITGNFGETGRSVGLNSGRVGAPNGISMPPIPPEMRQRAENAKSRAKKLRYNKQLLSYADMVTPWLENSYSNTCGGSFPVFLWQDAIEVAKNGKSRWNDGQIVPELAIKGIMNFGGNCLINQCGDSHLSASIIKDKSLCELIVSTDFFMTPSCLYSDYVLPAAMAFEKTFITTHAETLLHTPKAMEPLGECLSDYDIAAGIAKAYSDEAYNAYSNNGMSDVDIVRTGIEKNIANGAYDKYWPKIDSYNDLVENGIISGSTGSSIIFKKFRDNPIENPRLTPSGRFEVYSQLMMEDYEARHHDNIDISAENRGRLYNGGTLNSPRYQNSNRARFVYPIPMYIPLPEGRQACDDDKGAKTLKDFPNFDFKEAIIADPMELHSKFPIRLHTWHIQYRSHSTLNSNAYLNEIYKRDSDGNLTFSANDRGNIVVKGKELAAPDVWSENVYEPAYMNPTSIAEQRLKAGALVKVTSPRKYLNNEGVATIIVYLLASETVAPGDLAIPQGSWMHLNKAGEDIGGNANTLTSIRPSRICKGMSLGNDCRVKVERYELIL